MGGGVCVGGCWGLTKPPGAEAGVGAGGGPRLLAVQDVLHQLLQGERRRTPAWTPPHPFNAMDCKGGGGNKGGEGRKSVTGGMGGRWKP